MLAVCGVLCVELLNDLNRGKSHCEHRAAYRILAGGIRQAYIDAIFVIRALIEYRLQTSTTTEWTFSPTRKLAMMFHI